MNTFNVPMHRAVSIVFMLCVAVVTGVAVWCFRSGFLWSGICLIVVAGPLTVMYWYMLLINPARAVIGVGEEGLSIDAPPFTKYGIAAANIERVFESNLGEDETLAIHKLDGAMRFGKYRNGAFLLKSERRAIILTNSERVLGVETADGLFLLGPADFDRFAEAVRKIA